MARHLQSGETIPLMPLENNSLLILLVTTQRQIAVEWVTKYLQDSGRKIFKHDQTYTLLANTVYERSKNVIASFTCKNTSSNKQIKYQHNKYENNEHRRSLKKSQNR
jgi:hypothetical protein